MIRKTISMPDEMGDWITGRIARGQYNNESEYFRDLIRQDQAEDTKIRYLKNRLAQGEAEIAAGRYELLESDSDIDTLFDAIED